MTWLDQLYQKRFVIFIISLVAVLFGDLVFPEEIHEKLFGPLFLILNVLAGILLIYRNKKNKRIFIGLLIVIVLTHLSEELNISKQQTLAYVRFGMFFLFFAMVTLEVISQVWRSAHVDPTVILGVMSGYICLGLLGFFLFITIDIIEPGSFGGIREGGAATMGGRQDLLYFSFITLLTIGYGEMLPTSDLAKNAAVLLGLLGQFYMVIITAIVVGKFLSQRPSKQ